ncbi:hypothetical protein DWQ65_11255 [Treponema phagedenis]|uniref:Uncharacterized protein n=1 Tax=Treponema phagedenis TaxID=162 RepID=A0A0B7GWT7_TREPH|nr:DUF6672 family protein [Treponema phagedenis]NVP25156.1 hypothetical protein [Treponema phagedenis]QEJ96026.1 hypothetical protein FUT79_13005 [Treponema phagedenis]QEJ97270.1 hypothetical protein FUT82_04225 [Treponema phagedenis]QEK01790.1 hypothetical protein FUT84_11930 [Treponema phagedenis]QEK02537.1 hypothetical protein FUT83_01100 [Treponema phagedenis]
MIRIENTKIKIIIRISLAVIYVLLLCIMFLFGRTHTVLLDNRDAADGSYKAIPGFEIKLNNEDSIEMFKGDRDKILLRGQNHTLVVTFFDGTPPFKGEFQIPLFQDAVLLSIPALVNKHKNAISPFEMYSVQEE